MKISASLYSNKTTPREQLVEQLDRCHIDYFHIDCNDDPSVFEDIKKIREYSKTPIDLHIISNESEKYFDLLKETPVERVCFQYENMGKRLTFPKIPGTSYGLAIVSDTSVEVFDEYKDQCDFVLIMTTTPGQSGGKFRKDNFHKIRKFRNRFPGKEIEVDGGVNDETGFILRMLGVQSVVSGSYLVNHESIAEALLHLRSSIIHSDFTVKDFMIEKSEAPVVSNKASVKEIIEAIENYKLGFVIVEDEHGKLSGISSNADMRKGMLKKLNDLSKLNSADIVNTNPVSIHEDTSVADMLRFSQSKKFLVSYLPVVDSKNNLTGAVSFINLIRSES